MPSFIAPGLFDGPNAIRNWPWGDLTPQAYDMIMIDPPWRFVNWSERGEAKGPEAQYPTMDDEAILALPVADLAADNCVLWCWATWPKLPLAMQCISAWGFTFKTGGAWNKKRWGTGYIWRSVCEPVLIATRGDPAVNGSSIPNLIEESRREHSRKPDLAYAYAEKMAPGAAGRGRAARRVSLFERPVRPGWDGWGDQYGQPIQKRVKVSAADASTDEPLLV